ncbi:MAG: hypothetical protein A2541_01410 [Candidatus Taylorbacteria bacterium RIFOXYD2_FULL_36_9]|uniref:Uncharacterized protein n=1 Tax=Candidatus Taylorbacteria bacterium RIFOXYD2_FULL_36_9 TaxID=1802338 RepID=A0A1G2PDM3_9BACT|nr:MAG: hypothetical protein A2541_01410 [Candidatus Taylorbacteria bacterium RIFOXYD2_FULL_36_9]
MIKNTFWWVIEVLVWYFFFYLILYSIKNEVSIGGMALLLVLLASFGIFASPLSRHLSIWNKVLDKIIKKEEETEKY